MTTTESFAPSNSISPNACENADQTVERSLPVIHSNTSTLTLMIDSVLRPENGPNVRLFALLPKESRYPQVVAAQFDIVDFDAVSATRLLQLRFNEWVEDIASRVGSCSLPCDRRLSTRSSGRPDAQSGPLSRAMYVSVPIQSQNHSTKKAHQTTLLTLLAKLGQPDITTVEQRKVIRQSVTHYLNDNISLRRLFSFLTHVVGAHTMALVVQSLCDANTREETAAGDELTDNAQETALLRHTTKSFHTSGAKHLRCTSAVYDASPFDVSSVHLALYLKHFICQVNWIKPGALWNTTDAYGARIVAFNDKAFIMGGILLANPAPNAEPVTPTFEQFKLLNLNNFFIQNITSHPSFGCRPPSLMYHSLHLASLPTGPLILVHGGMHLPSHTRSFVAQQDDKVYLNDLLFSFDVQAMRWSYLDANKAIRPCARHSHASAIYPPTENSYVSHLIIFGGVGNKTRDTETMSYSLEKSTLSAFRRLISVFSDELQPLNDLWVFHFPSRSWTCVEAFPSPAPRFGVQFVWANNRTLVLFGGEGRANSTQETEVRSVTKLCGTPPGATVIFDDCFVLSCYNLDADSCDTLQARLTWTKSRSKGTKLAHYASVGLTVSIRPTEGDMRLYSEIQERNGPRFTSRNASTKHSLDTQWVDQRLLFLISGTTVKEGKLHELSSVFLGIVVNPRESVVDVIWIELEQGSVHEHECALRGRRGHTALSFHTTQEPLFEAQQRENLKNLSLYPRQHSGVTHLYTASSENCARTSPDALSVPCILVTKGLNSEGGCVDQTCILKLSELYPNVTSSMRRMMLHHQAFANLLLSGPQWLFCIPALTSRELNVSDDDPYEEEHDNRIITLPDCRARDRAALASLYRDVCTPLSKFRKVAESGAGHLFSCLRSMCNSSMSAFGHLIRNASESQVQASTIHVKIRRWRDTPTVTVIDDGIGLSHQALYIILKSYGRKCENPARNAPFKFGMGFKFALSLLSKNCLIFTRTAWAVGVGLFSTVLQTLFSPSTVSTPIVFWSSITGLPLTLRFQEADLPHNLQLILANTPLQTIAALNKELEGLACGTRFVFWDLHSDVPKVHDTGRVSPSPESSLSTGTVSPTVSLQSEFPFFSNDKDTIDQSLATYMYWVELHSAVKLYLNDTLLVPSPHKLASMQLRADTATLCKSDDHSTVNTSPNLILPCGLSLAATDPYANSLWRCLQNNLYHKLELPYLFKPKFSYDNFYGLVGFLNDPDGTNPNHVYETGVLLYHNECLINRAVHPIPSRHHRRSSGVFDFNVTAVINVPDFFLPRATKEEFLYDGDLAIHDFYDQVESVLLEYLSVHSDPLKLSALQARYVERLDDYWEASWNEKADYPTYDDPQAQRPGTGYRTRSGMCVDSTADRFEADPQTNPDECALYPSEMHSRGWKKRSYRFPNGRNRSLRLITSDIDAELTDPGSMSDVKEDSPAVVKREYADPTCRRRKKKIHTTSVWCSS